MPVPAKHKVVIIGCGNVAWHLAKHLAGLKNYSVSVYNHRKNAELVRFSKSLHCKTVVGLNAIDSKADLYFICVADQFIAAVSKKIKTENKNAVLLHTAGSLPLDEIKNDCPNKGVFYPLQTFSKKDNINWKELPVITEASNAFTKKRLSVLVRDFTKKTTVLKYKDRLQLHLCAVLVNNFTNALFVTAFELLKKNNFKLLLPIIHRTVDKLETLEPRNAQTGPAKRNDQVVIKKHLALLSKNDQLKNIYKQMTALIATQQKKHA